MGPLISEIQDELLAELREAAAGSYGTVAHLEKLAEENPDDPPLEVLERAFNHYFLEGQQFDKSLFHFLLTRLGAVQSRIGISYCLEGLAERPEETEHALRYFSKVGLAPQEHEAIVQFLSGQSSLYEYQNYLILKFYFDTQMTVPGITSQCRTYLRELGRPHWLRAYAAGIIIKYGDAADLEYFEAQYPNCRDAVERCNLHLQCLGGMEARRRNEFLGRVRRDGDVEERACRWVRQRI